MEKNSLRETVYAFNKHDVVATYDLDMDMWHPNRAKMASIICEILPFHRDQHLQFLDLGVGTGYLSFRIIETFPRVAITATDAAELMVEKAKVRLCNHIKQVVFRITTFQELTQKENAFSNLDAVVSLFALHHLYREEKLALFKYIHSILKPNGWFINGDIFKTLDGVLESRFQYLHYRGIQQRMKMAGNQEKTLDQLSADLTEKEKKDGDHLLYLTDDLQLLKEAGFRTAECFWKEYREAVYGGIK